MKNKLMLIPVLLLVASLFTGCAPKTNEPEDNRPEDPKAAATAVVDALYGDLKNNNLGDFDTYFVADAALEEEFNASIGIFADMDSLMESFNAQVGDMAGLIDQTILEQNVGRLIDKIVAAFDYSIESVTLNDDSTVATITVLANVPDLDVANLDMDDTAMADAMTEAFGFDINDPVALMTAWAEKKGMTPEELSAELAAATDPNALTADMLNAFSAEFGELVTKLFDTMINGIADMPANEIEQTITVTKQADDTWKISDME